MKFMVSLHRGSQVLEHELELTARAAHGSRRFVLDGAVIQAHSEEISPGAYSLLVEGRPYEAQVAAQPGEAPGLTSSYVVLVGLRQYRVELRDPRRSRRARSGLEAQGPQEIIAPMPGKVMRVLVRENQEVKSGQGLLVIEAMKMQNELHAPRDGRVERVYVAEGRGVDTGARLLRLV
jgi:biotin carboxyl carrier protein